jgi:hypothetical protein
MTDVINALILLCFILPEWQIESPRRAEAAVRGKKLPGGVKNVD